MINDVDEALRSLLLDDLKKSGSSVKDAAQISFGLPSAVESPKGGKPVVNLYLHDVRENPHLRDESVHTLVRDSQSATRQRGPVRLDLSYLVTVHAEDIAAEHRVLSEVIAVFLKNPTIRPELLPESLQSFGASAVLLSIAQANQPAHASPSALWSALGGQIRPMLGLLATAAFNPFETQVTKLVREALFGIGIGTPPHGPMRPLDLMDVRASAAGIVYGPDGETPMPDVLVSVAGREEKALTDGRGLFHIDNLPKGKHKLVFWKRGYQKQEVEVMAPPPGRPDLLEPVGITIGGMSDKERATEEKELAEGVLNSPGLVEVGRKYTVAVSGRLKYEDGRPASYIPVRIGEKRTITDGEGMYRFTDLPPGDPKLIVEMPGRGDLEMVPKDGAAVLPAKK
jgi:hypothetical protein